MNLKQIKKWSKKKAKTRMKKRFDIAMNTLINKGMTEEEANQKVNEIKETIYDCNFSEIESIVKNL